MKFEDAIGHLREGKRIYRKSKPDKGSLCGTTEKVLGSFCMTLFDVLAEDWVVEKSRREKEKIQDG